MSSAAPTATLLELLQQILQLESHSFLLYLRDAGAARVTVHDRELKRLLDELIHHEEQDLQRMLALIAVHGGKADYARSFDMEAASYHYLELPYLMRVVQHKLQRQLEQVRLVLHALCSLDRQVAHEVGEVVARKESDLRKLQLMLEQHQGASRRVGAETQARPSATPGQNS
jgi:hypothetical protein